MLRLRLSVNAPKIFKRNVGILAPALQKATDPIQQLFIDKIREYANKSQGGKLVDPTPDIEKERKSELEKLANQFGCAPGTKMSDFPSFSFTDPPIDSGVSKS
ncbi:PREDICTED: ATP synthase-coupling factor 6, mitochondrial-like [Polistes dominula]|uniref:ATP synthase-coupling factor 6, mitochondrial-like n=1 Tax=Polistes dominula TaxID=743375 RepID=A0ABM1JDV7_POLDO|nr:PREDICTED: ATP synthase-coupling factor 6, mitochondrial-like [Polistes dominula]